MVAALEAASHRLNGLSVVVEGEACINCRRTDEVADGSKGRCGYR